MAPCVALCPGRPNLGVCRLQTAALGVDEDVISGMALGAPRVSGLA